MPYRRSRPSPRSGPWPPPRPGRSGWAALPPGSRPPRPDSPPRWSRPPPRPAGSGSGRSGPQPSAAARGRRAGSPRSGSCRCRRSPPAPPASGASPGSPWSCTPSRSAPCSGSPAMWDYSPCLRRSKGQTDSGRVRHPLPPAPPVSSSSGWRRCSFPPVRRTPRPAPGQRPPCLRCRRWCSPPGARPAAMRGWRPAQRSSSGPRRSAPASSRPFGSGRRPCTRRGCCPPAAPRRPDSCCPRCPATG